MTRGTRAATRAVQARSSLRASTVSVIWREPASSRAREPDGRFAAHLINIDDLITHHLKLEDINKGFDLMKAGESIRYVVVY